MNKFKLSFLYRQLSIRTNVFLRLYTTLGDVIVQYCPCTEEFQIVNGCEQWTYTFCVQDADLPAGLDVCNITADIVRPPYLAAIPPVSFEDSLTVDITGDGSEGNPYSANLIIDPDAENGVESRANGVFADTSSGTDGKDGADGADGAGLPVGSIIWIPGTAPPAGMLECRGQLETRATYPALWNFASASGNLTNEATWEGGNFSSGNGSTTFRLPDLRGEFVRGWDNGKGTDTGRAIGSFQDFMQETVTGSVLSTYYTCPRSSATGVFASSTYSGNGSNTTPDFTRSGEMGKLVFDSSDSTAKTGNETRPRSIALMGCIQAIPTAS